jgi:hypothetical protein
MGEHPSGIGTLEIGIGHGHWNPEDFNWIWGSYGGDYEEYGLLGCGAA